MTHERIANDEAKHGPEHDYRLPNAETIPGDLTAEESDADPLDEDLD